MKLKNLIAIITGEGTTIGRARALRFALRNNPFQRWLPASGPHKTAPAPEVPPTNPMLPTS